MCIKKIKEYRERRRKEIEAKIEAEEKRFNEEYERRRKELEKLNNSSPHEFVLYLYPDELPEGITYQELEREVIKADIEYDKFNFSFSYDRLSLRESCVNSYVSKTTARNKLKKHIQDYENRYGVKFADEWYKETSIDEV